MRTRADGSIMEGEEQIRSRMIFAIVSFGSSSAVRPEEDEVFVVVVVAAVFVARHFRRYAKTLCRRCEVSRRVVVLS